MNVLPFNLASLVIKYINNQICQTWNSSSVLFLLFQVIETKKNINKINYRKYIPILY